MEATFYVCMAMERDRERITELVRILENVRGDVYLWRIGETSAQNAMEAIQESADDVPWWAHRYAAHRREEVSATSGTGA